METGPGELKNKTTPNPTTSLLTKLNFTNQKDSSDDDYGGSENTISSEDDFIDDDDDEDLVSNDDEEYGKKKTRSERKKRRQKAAQKEKPTIPGERKSARSRQGNVSVCVGRLSLVLRIYMVLIILDSFSLS